MDLSNKKNRNELKAFFKKNSIPTESNFADLIEGALNQKEDGIAKLPNNPLSIEADASPQKNVLALYSKLPDSLPAWTLSLKDSSGSQDGLSINDASNISRLFIGTNGNVGIGVTNPAEKLDINGRLKTEGLTTGTWPANPSVYVFWGTNTLNQAQAGNYALLQGTTGGDKGRTFLNSPLDVRIRINNADKLIISNNGLEVNGTVKVNGNLQANSISIPQEDWIPPPLLNGWTNYANTFNTAGYFKDSFGIVHLKGLVRNGPANQPIFTLPNGYRPVQRELHAVSTNPNTIGRIDILTNGDIIMISGNNEWISLDGITFRAALPFFINPILIDPIIPHL